MGNVISFPGVDPARIRPRPTCIADLKDGAQALVVIAERSGFAVVIRPAVTEKDRLAHRTFASVETALSFARSIAIRNFWRFQLILDETMHRPIAEIMAAGPDSHGRGGVA